MSQTRPSTDVETVGVYVDDDACDPDHFHKLRTGVLTMCGDCGARYYGKGAAGGCCQPTATVAVERRCQIDVGDGGGGE